jgi:carbonic anhydrase
MYKKVLVSAVLVTMLVATSGCSYKGESVKEAQKDSHAHHATHHWGYDKENGPDHWGELEEKFFMCKEGKNQSPIDLMGAVEVSNSPLNLYYKAGGTDFVYNGHALQVNYEEGSSFSIDEDTFNLKQFHFHTPSENSINGKQFPMEAHLVHLDKNGNIAVVAIMFKEGKKNALIDTLLKNIPTKIGQDNTLSQKVNISSLLPTNKDYFRFNGSLTTPPCSEGVLWIVLKEPVEVSREQIKAFADDVKHPNNRPIQPINARIIVK